MRRRLNRMMCSICKELVIKRSAGMLGHEDTAGEKETADNQRAEAFHLSESVGIEIRWRF